MAAKAPAARWSREEFTTFYMYCSVTLGCPAGWTHWRHFKLTIFSSYSGIVRLELHCKWRCICKSWWTVVLAAMWVEWDKACPSSMTTGHQVRNWESTTDLVPRQMTLQQSPQTQCPRSDVIVKLTSLASATVMSSPKTGSIARVSPWESPLEKNEAHSLPFFF